MQQEDTTVNGMMFVRDPGRRTKSVEPPGSPEWRDEIAEALQAGAYRPSAADEGVDGGVCIDLVTAGVTAWADGRRHELGEVAVVLGYPSLRDAPENSVVQYRIDPG